MTVFLISLYLLLIGDWTTNNRNNIY